MEEAKSDPALAGKIIPGRIHPGASAELVMAQTLLKSWSAPATVSSVAINAAAATVQQSENTRVIALSKENGSVSWTEIDNALPYPIMTLHSTKWPQFPPEPWGDDEAIFWQMPPLSSPSINPVAAMVARLSRMYQMLDLETLRVASLAAPNYALRIDGHLVGTFSNDRLTRGINLARYDTPMMEQAHKVLRLVWHRVDVRFYGWRAIQVPLKDDSTPGLQQAVSNILGVLNNEQDDLIASAHAAAQPVPRRYELSPASR
jgi:hypothetical protein